MTGLIAGSRCGHLQGFMRSFAVVDISPSIVVMLAVIKIDECPPGDELILERSMKALILAKCLWVTDP